MKMNNSPLTSQQQELKKRLEEIRTKRNAESSPPQNKKQQPLKRNESTQKKAAQTRKQTPTPSSPATPRPLERKNTTSQSDIFTQEIGASRTKRRQTKSASKKRQKNNLVKQLTHADSLKDAIILSEIVSKPIALRNRNR